MRTLILFAFSCFLFSCQSEDVVEFNKSDDLLGIWQVEKEESINNEFFTTYKQVPEVSDEIAIIFEKNNIFKSYDYGWCGTPPHSFNFTIGTYSKNENKVTLEIQHFYLNNKTLEIIDLKDNKLVVKSTR